MAENETIRKQIVSIDVDTAASKRVKQHVQELKRELAGLKTSAAQMNVGFAETGRQSTQVAQMTKEVTRLKQETRGAAEETKRLVQSENTLAQRQSTQSLRRVETSVRAVTSPIAMLGGGDLVRPLNVGADLFGAAEGVKLLKRDLGDLTGQLNLSRTGIVALSAGAIAAAAAFVVADQLLSNTTQKTRQIIQARNEAIKDFYQESAGATTEDTRKKIQSLTQERNALVRTSSALETEQRRFEQANSRTVSAFVIATDKVANASEKIPILGSLLGPLQSGYSDQEDAIKNVNKELEKNKKATDLWTNALNENALAVRAAQSATELHAVWTQAASDAQAYIDQQLKLNSLYGLTTEEVDKQREAVAVQLRAMESSTGLGEFIRQFDEAVKGGTNFETYGKVVASDLERIAQEFININEPIGPMLMNYVKLRAEYDLYNSSMVQQAAAQNTNRKFAEDFTKALEKNQAAFASYQQEIERTNAQRLTQSIREEEDAARQRTNAIAQHYQDLAQLDEQTAERRADILTDIADASADTEKDRLKTVREANQEAIQAAREHRQRLIDIQRGTNADIRKAALHLDAVGIWEAQQAGEEALRQEDEQYQEEKRQRDADTRDRLREIKEQRDDKIRAGKQALRDLDQQHAKERDAKIRAFQQQQTREDQERAIRLQRQQQDWAREDLLRAQNFQNQLGATSTFYSDLNGRVITGTANIAATVSTWLSGLVTMAQQQLAAPPASSYHTGGSRYTPSAYATGTPRTRADEWAWTGEGGPELVRFMQPSRVYNHADSMRMMRPSLSIGDIIVQGGGAPRETAMAVRDEVLRVMYEFYQGKRN